MKQFISFLKKEFHHILRDRRTMLILLGMPMAQIIIFGFALTNEVKNSKVAVLDHARDLASIAITREIDASRYFNIEKELSRYDQIEPAFRKGKIKLAVIFPPGFNEDLLRYNKAQVQLIADASDPNVANTLTNYASSIILNYQDRLTNGQQLPYTIHTEVRMLYNPGLKGAYSFVPGVMAMVLMLVCTMMTAITIVREKEMGTMEILLVSPISPLKVIIAKAIPYLFFSIVNIISILLLSVFVLDVPINGSAYLLMAVSILFALTSLSLGLLISAATDSQQTAMFISLVGLFLPTVMLSGFMFPIENMPILLQVISNVVPAKWFYTIVRSVMIKGGGFWMIWKQVAVLTGMMLFFLVLSNKKFKIRLA